MLGLKKITTEYTKIKDCVDAVVEFVYKKVIESLSSTSLYLASVFLNSYDPLLLATKLNPGKLMGLPKPPKLTYCKVASSSLSQLVAHFQIFRRLMKGKFYAYVL